MEQWLFFLPGRIGDWIEAEPVVRRFQQQRDCQVDWAVREQIVPLLPLGLPYRRVVTLPPRLKLRDVLSFAWRLRRLGHYDGLAILTQGRTGLLAKWFVRADHTCGYLYGHEPRGIDAQGRRFVFDPAKEHHLGRVLRALEGNTGSALRADLVRELDLHVHLAAPSPAKPEAMAALSGAGLEGAPFVLLFVRSISRSRTWPAPSWVELIRQLASAGVRVALATGPGETNLTRQMVADAGLPSSAALPVLALPDLATVVFHASVVICLDSGPMHLAAAMGKRIVAIFGPNRPDTAAPIMPDDRLTVITASEPCPLHPCINVINAIFKDDQCPRGDHGCMARLNATQVAHAALSQMEAETGFHFVVQREGI